MPACAAERGSATCPVPSSTPAERRPQGCRNSHLLGLTSPHPCPPTHGCARLCPEVPHGLKWGASLCPYPLHSCPALPPSGWHGKLSGPCAPSSHYPCHPAALYQPRLSLAPLQSILHAAAQVICLKCKSDPAAPWLKSLQSLHPSGSADRAYKAFWGILRPPTSALPSLLIFPVNTSRGLPSSWTSSTPA